MPHPLTFRPRRAFTLIELMVSIALGMVIMGLAASAYQHAQKIIRRTEAMVRLHALAGDIAGQWERDVTCLMQTVGCNGTVMVAGGARTKVQFTGMRTLREFWECSVYDFPYPIDQVWVRWEWKAATRSLTRAQSPPPHWYVWYPNLRVRDIDSGALREVVGMRPSPIRDYDDEFLQGRIKFNDPVTNVGAVRTVPCFDLLFLTGLDADGTTRIYNGMAAELTQSALSGDTPNDHFPDPIIYPQVATASVPSGIPNWALRQVPVLDRTRIMADNVEDCSIAIVSRQGTLTEDTGAGFSLSPLGERPDGTETAVVQARPRQLRLTLTLVDRVTQLRQSFTFTSKAP